MSTVVPGYAQEILKRYKRKVAKLRFFEKCGYVPEPFQKQIHCCDARFIAFSGPARVGKSYVLGHEALYTASFPNKRIWFVGTSYTLSEKEFLHAKNAAASYRMKNGKRLIDYARVSNNSRGSRCIDFKWNSQIITRSTKVDDDLLGDELDLIVLSEGSKIPRRVWDKILMARLTTRLGRMLTGSTPNEDFGLFCDMIKWGKSLDPRYKDWAAFDSVNPLDVNHYNHEEYFRALAELGEENPLFKEQFKGEFVSMRGRVFPNFNEDHVLQDNELPDMSTWPIMRTIYHHKNAYNMPYVCLWIAINPETKELFVIKEFYRQQITTKDIYGYILEQFKGRTVIATLTDFYNKTLKEALKKHGIKASSNNESKFKEKQAVIRRVAAVQNVFKRDKPGIKVLISAACKETVRELRQAKWPDARKEEEGRAESEFPLDRDISTAMALSFVVGFMLRMYGEDYMNDE